MSIPKVFNFFWGYGVKLSYLRYLSMATCRALHPTWPIYLWQCNWSNVSLSWGFHEFQTRIRGQHDYSKEAQSLLGVQMKEYVPDDKRILEMPPPNISDIFSYDRLYKEGGWYSDMDVAFIKPFDSISDMDYAFIGFGGLDDWVGIFGSIKGSWVLKSFYDACVDNYSGTSYNSTGTYGIIKNCSTNIDWCNSFKQGDKGLKNWRAPSDMFYPLRPEMTRLIWSDVWQTPKPMTWTVHLYGANQDYAIMNKRLTPNYVWDPNHNEWFCRYIRSLGNQLLFIDKDPIDPIISIVKEKVEVKDDQHTVPNVREEQDTAPSVPQLPSGDGVKLQEPSVHVSSESSGPGDDRLPISSESSPDPSSLGGQQEAGPGALHELGVPGDKVAD